MDIVYLDFDGALHPGEVWFDRTTRRSQLREPGHELFESVHLFEAAIAPYASVQIILSTSWVQTYGLEQTRAFLPMTLQPRVIGATYDPRSPDAWRWARLTRYDQIALDVQRRKPRWLAIDDNALGWPPSAYESLVLVPTQLGLACPRAQALLHARLKARFP
jgi:hypothetical protein